MKAWIPVKTTSNQLSGTCTSSHPWSQWCSRRCRASCARCSQSASSVTIQVFVILAVALGIASVLTVAVVQKDKEIGILRATGTRAASVTRIFLIQGAVLGTVGSLIGVAFGTGLALLFSQLFDIPTAVRFRYE